MPISLTDRSIIITGASSGIGRATALACAEAGMDVVIGARREQRLRDLAAEIERLGRRAVVVPGDVIDRDMTPRLLEAAGGLPGGLDAVFANAGYGLDLPGHETPDDELRGIFDVNFFASAELVTEAARRLVAAGRPGHLLMCSSCLSEFTIPRHSAYSATKAAQKHLCRAMRIELRPHRIEVASVHPITTITEFFQASRRRSGREVTAGDAPAHAPRLFVQPPERVARAIVRCLRRPRPEVWTSFTVRAVAAAMTLSPRFADLVMGRAGQRDGEGQGA